MKHFRTHLLLFVLGNELNDKEAVYLAEAIDVSKLFILVGLYMPVTVDSLKFTNVLIYY